MQAWEFAHGDRDNSGFANVVTAPAKKAPITVPGLGRFALGAGPVVAPDGTVYLGTIQGKLIALHADGKPFWSRDISPGQSIVASPAIASDGSIYVIGVRTVRDNRVDPPVTTVTSTLHHFNNSGAWLDQIAFPQHGEVRTRRIRPAEHLAIRQRRSDHGADRLPSQVRGGHTLRLIAFSLSGQVLDDTVVISIVPQVARRIGPAGLGGCFMPGPGSRLAAVSFRWRVQPAGSGAAALKAPPVPGVGIFTFAGGGTPFILVSDHYKDLVGFTFSGQRFTEIFRVHENDFFMRTPPMILPDGHTLIGQQSLARDNIGAEMLANDGRIIFTKPNGNPIAPVKLVNAVWAAPTRMADGRVALVDRFGNVLILKDGRLFDSMTGAGISVASAAASRTHIFVSGYDGFVTYDTNSLAEVARIDWVGGGLNPPAIGPQGHVYAIASDILFVFPPPKQSPLGGYGGRSGGQTVATNPDPSIRRPTRRPSRIPMTANGNRLFACEELDQDDCGKGDYQTIATAFCKKQGFIGAGKVDVDSKKVKAETLDGRFCSKNKCKVFEEIRCANN